MPLLKDDEDSIRMDRGIRLRLGEIAVRESSESIRASLIVCIAWLDMLKLVKLDRCTE